MMKSCIYEGTVRHRRFQPVRNQFRYRIFFMYLDLAELNTVFNCHPFWSLNRPNIATFRRSDHLGDPHAPLDAAVREHIHLQTGEYPQGPIRLLTHLRYFGYCFNPVSFFYLYNPADTRLQTILAEVRNTPWLEQHPYVLDSTLNEHPVPDWRRYRFKKAFHVSPFLDMDLDYDWRFRVPGRTINVHMRVLRDDQRMFDATLALQRRPLNRDALTRVLIVYPLMTLKVTMMIYWQALRLVSKRTTVYTHPKKRTAINELEKP